ncbi:MAG: MFS transporter [Acidimicrobiales bacterium]
MGAVAKILRSDERSRASVFRVPGFARIYSVGVVWSFCRWAIGFLGAYVVSDMTGSPRLVQLTGTLLWAPLLFAGVVGGAVSDRFPRRALMLAQFAILAPLTVVVGMLAITDRLPLWLIYAYMATAGFGWVIDMTVRRAMVYDLVGDEYIDRAMAFEGLASSFGLAIGALAGGILIGTVGAGGAYLSVSGAIAFAGLLMLRVPQVDPASRAVTVADEAAASGQLAASQPSLRSEVVDGLRLVGRWPILASVLGVTALTNFFHFSYFPIVPVIAEGLDASPAATGALAAATGLGMAVGSTIVLRFRPRRGRVYVLGSAGAFVCMLGFAGFDRYWLVFASLFVAAAFVGMFGATQSVLTMTSVGEQERGRAMGLLSMAIGMLPLGMATLGEVAEVVGPRPALIGSNLLGLAALVLFLRRRPEVLRVD